MAIMAVYFQPPWWILLNYWPLWRRDGFASVLQIAGHHCDIQVKSTWHTEQVLTDYETECKASRLIIICCISGWGMLIESDMRPKRQIVKASLAALLIHTPSPNLCHRSLLVCVQHERRDVPPALVGPRFYPLQSELSQANWQWTFPTRHPQIQQRPVVLWEDPSDRLIKPPDRLLSAARRFMGNPLWGPKHEVM